MPGLTDVVALASMDINDNVQFAVLRNGTVAGWGSNRGAQAGCGQVDVSTATLTAPRPVNGLQSIFAAAAGTAHALFVDLDGAVYGCGSNANGQLGDSTTAGTDVGQARPRARQPGGAGLGRGRRPQHQRGGGCRRQCVGLGPGAQRGGR